MRAAQLVAIAVVTVAAACVVRQGPEGGGTAGPPTGGEAGAGAGGGPTVETITDESVVYEATLAPGEKPATVRQQLKSAARRAGVEIAVRRSPKGFYFGLLTPERRSNRGRKPKAPAAEPAG